MRDIEFRGKQIDNGEWVYGYLYITHNGEYEISNYDTKYNIERMTHIVIPETVGQYIGLTDKNGTRIFEGDILGGFGNRKLEIYYDTAYCQFRVAENGGRNREIDYYCGYPLKFEIIGNIHDNPELLKRGE